MLRKPKEMIFIDTQGSLVLLSRQFILMSVPRTDRRNTFFCFAKRKYPKKRRPGFRQFPALLTFGEGFRRAIPGPSKTSGIHAASPCGPISPKAAMLGAE